MTQKSYLAQNYARSPIEFVKGEGAYLIDSTGREYLDFGSGIAVNALGHSHPYLISAMQDAIQRPWHLSNIFTIPEQEKLGKRLCETSFADRAFFCNSGAEALEASFKMARRYHYLQGNQHKYRIITLTGAFHGRTLATTAATGNANYLEGFGPKVEGFDQVAFMNLNEMRSAIGDASTSLLSSVSLEISADNSPSLSCAEFMGLSTSLSLGFSVSPTSPSLGVASATPATLTSSPM